jgi:hypothetical protein
VPRCQAGTGQTHDVQSSKANEQGSDCVRLMHVSFIEASF